jgi:membrane-associated protease RseP (regulator of RpoE activity)
MCVPGVTPEPAQVWPPPCEPPVWWGPPRPRRLWLHIALFLATVLTTMASGAFQFGVNLFEYPWRIYQGIPFAASILAILTSHEMSHFLASRRQRLDVSLPYFLPGIPFPPPLPGTFGALIRIRSPILDKRTLVEVGCSGPLMGVLVAVPVLVVGLLLSPVKTLPAGIGEGIQLGEPLLFKLLCWLTVGSLGPDEYVIMHPVAYAGWLGLLITSLNLLPVGQLDGGHVMYALFPRWHRRISIACLAMLVVFGILSWQGWLLWATLLTVLGIRHPPPYCDWIPLDRRHKALGWLTIAVFLLTFTPMPLNLS